MRLTRPLLLISAQLRYYIHKTVVLSLILFYHLRAVFYFLTRILHYFYSYELKIIDPPNRKSLTQLPTVFSVHGSTWWKILLGAATLLVLIAGFAQLAPSSNLPSTSEIVSYSITGLFITLAFINQMILSGRITVHKEGVDFKYRSVFGVHNKRVALSNYESIWVQKLKMRPKVLDHGSPYIMIRLKHSWTRFRSIPLYEGPWDEGKIQYYSDLFGLPVKTSRVTIRRRYI